MALPPRWLGRRFGDGDDERRNIDKLRAVRTEQVGIDTTCADCDDVGRLTCADGRRRCQACTFLFEAVRGSSSKEGGGDQVVPEEAEGGV